MDLDATGKLTISGDYLAGGVHTVGNLRLFNIADPAQPRQVGYISNLPAIFDLAMRDSYIYVAGGSGGLAILRVLQEKEVDDLGS